MLERYLIKELNFKEIIIYKNKSSKLIGSYF